MASEWAPIALGDVCTKIGSGATPRGGRDVYLSSGPYALVRSQNVYNDGFHHDGLAYIGDQHAAELANVEVLEGDVLLNITGDSVARACQVDPRILPARVNQHVAIIRPDPSKLDPRFLRYLLVSPDMQTKLLSWAGSGGTRNALTKGMIESFEVEAPTTIDDQCAIAHILGTLDDKIELNRRMSETLEAMARALFKSWFVDFDPVRAKAEGRDPGLPQPLVDFVPLGLRADTREVPFEDVIDFKEGPGIMARDFRDSGVPLIRLAGMEHSASLLAGCNFLDPIAVRERWSHFRLNVGDTLLSTSASLGRVAVVSEEAAGAIPYTGIIRMRPRNDQLLPEMIAYVLRSEHFQAQVEAVGAGSVLRHFGPTHLRQMTVRVGAIEVQRTFVRLMTPIWSKIRANREESATLATLREALLPKLISGELRLDDPKRVLRSVG